MSEFVEVSGRAFSFDVEELLDDAGGSESSLSMGVIVDFGDGVGAGARRLSAEG